MTAFIFTLPARHQRFKKRSNIVYTLQSVAAHTGENTAVRTESYWKMVKSVIFRKLWYYDKKSIAAFQWVGMKNLYCTNFSPYLIRYNTRSACESVSECVGQSHTDIVIISINQKYILHTRELHAYFITLKKYPPKHTNFVAHLLY